MVTQDETETPPPPEDCVGAQLDTLRHVMKAMAATLRLLKAGKMPASTAGVLVNGYASLAKMMQDSRDAKWTKRSELMWREREAAKANAQPEANH